MFYLLIAAIGFSSLISTQLDAKPFVATVNAESAILMNAETGAILFEKEAYKLQFPASTTKIATVMYALKQRSNDLDKKLVGDADCLGVVSDAAFKKANYLPPYRLVPGNTHMGIKKGEELSIKDLLYGTILVSACDASNILAKEVGDGSIVRFMDQLNDYLRSLGCNQTTYKNPHGLYHPDHMTTAFDLATMTRAALKDPAFCEIVKTVRYLRPDTNKQKASPMVNMNRLLKPGKFYYPHAIGVKTGYFSLAKNNLVAAAKSGDRVLIAVLLKSDGREEIFRDTKDLFNQAFAEKKVRKLLLSAGPQKAVINPEGSQKPIQTYLKEDASIEFYPSEEPAVKAYVEWNKVTLPVVKDQVLGMVHIKDSKGSTLLSRPLYATEDVKMGWLKLIGPWLKRNTLWIFVIAIGAYIFFFLFFRTKK